jgi:hypothetical protein
VPLPVSPPPLPVCQRRRCLSACATAAATHPPIHTPVACPPVLPPSLHARLRHYRRCPARPCPRCHLEEPPVPATKRRRGLPVEGGATVHPLAILTPPSCTPPPVSVGDELSRHCPQATTLLSLPYSAARSRLLPHLSETMLQVHLDVAILSLASFCLSIRWP